MDKRVSLIQPEIQEILSDPKAFEMIRDAFGDMHPYDIFSLCEDLEHAEIAACIQALGVTLGTRVFQQFDNERKKEIFDCFNKEWMAQILDEMATDDRADFVKYLPEERLEIILPLVARAERHDIKKLINYREGTAGSILTTEYASLAPETIVKESIDKLRHQAFDSETIYYVYVVDGERKLLGSVTLREIILAPANKTIEEIMNRNIISASVTDEKGHVAKLLADYDLLAIPIVEEGERLVGIVTVDDVVDVVQEEATEDMYKYGAAGDYLDYMKASIFQMAKQRVMWLMILVCVGFITGMVIQKNSSKIQAIVALSFFMPLILGAGGNAGTQSSTVVIRGLATGRIDIKDLVQVFKKEMLVGILMGLMVASVGSLGAMSLGHNANIGLTVGSAMVCSVMLATTLGALLPIIFKKLKLDPALMSGPFITSIVDVVSLLIYFKIATIIFFS